MVLGFAYDGIVNIGMAFCCSVFSLMENGFFGYCVFSVGLTGAAIWITIF